MEKAVHLDALKKATTYLELHTPTMREAGQGSLFTLRAGRPFGPALSGNGSLRVTLQEFQKTYQRLGISF